VRSGILGLLACCARRALQKRIAEGTVASLDHFRHTFIISRRQKS
jgi:hypothetical protein